MSEPTLEGAPGPSTPPDPAAAGAARGFDLRGAGMRAHAARGALVNSAFTVGLNFLNLLRGFVVAAFLSPSDYGVWGVLVIALGTLNWLKQVGFSEKYVQQDEEDQEQAFQKAFTLELAANLVLMVAMVGAIPLAVAVYGQHEIVAPGLAVILVIPALVLQTPLWVYYRRMDFVRQRTLQAVDPVLGFVVAIALAAAGAGYWAFVAAMLVGAWANALVVWRQSPYPLRLRWNWSTTREYATFSWPLFVSSAGGLIIAQGTVIAASRSLGLAAVGAINLATTLSGYTHRVDEVITTTLYPAICAVKDRLDLLAEAFVKSNRLTLMWGMPFGVGVALFVADLIHFVLGDRWAFGIHLMQATGLVAAINHIGFNWHAFFRARNDTRPLAILTWATVAVFAVGPIPLMLTKGIDGYAAGLLVAALVTLAIRGWFLARLFSGFQMARHVARALAPTVPAAAIVLGIRAVDPLERSLPLAIAEAAVYLAVTAVATWEIEKGLLREAVGYLRRRSGGLAPTSAPPTPA